MAQSMHHSASDARNADVVINVNGALKPRDEAMVSVFDSGFVLGDGAWEGLRVHKGRLNGDSYLTVPRLSPNCPGRL